MLHSVPPIVVICSYEIPCKRPTNSYRATQICNNPQNFNSLALMVGSMSLPLPGKSIRREKKHICSVMETNGSSSDEEGETRLGRIASRGGRRLLEKLSNARRNVPAKVFLVLLGFYTANAVATILGQTGDWDVLVAGLVVAAIEGIGMLMYRKPPGFVTKRFRGFVGMLNFWKAGVCLGLFVDAFKLGS